MHSVAEIERAIIALEPQDLAELLAWLDQRRATLPSAPTPTVFEEGLGLFGNPEDAALLDDVVELAYHERCRPSARA